MPAQQYNHPSLNAVRCLTVFHDIDACTLAQDEDMQAVMDQTFASIDAVTSQQESATKASQLALEWRCFKPEVAKLSPALAEQFVDLGVSCIATGRKVEAVGQKIRNDLVFFIDSHSVTHDHAVVLLVSDTSKYAGELRALGRAGVLTFVISAQAPSSISPSARCYCAGQWHQVLSNARNSSRNSNKPMPASPAVDEQQIASQWAAISETSSLDEAAVSAAILEAVGPSAWKSIATAHNTPRRPSKLASMSVGAVRTDATDETKGDDEEGMWHPMMSSRRTRSSSRSNVSQFLAFPRGDDWFQATETKSEMETRTTNATALFTTTVQVQPQTNTRDNTSLGGGGSGSVGANAANRRAGWTATPNKAKHVNTNATPTTNSTAGDSSSFDPYRIVFGKLQRPSEACISITERDAASKHDLQKSQLDFDYCWLKQLSVGSSSGVAVCCRLHKSGRVTDIRLCGQVARVVRGDFGFIKHEFFPGNLYFRTADVDPSGGASGSTALSEGAIVAFRIGRKGERVWALRVWKTPDGMLDSLMRTTSAPRPFGTSRNTNTHNNRNAKSKKHTRHRRNNSRGHNHNYANKRPHRFAHPVMAQ